MEPTSQTDAIVIPFPSTRRSGASGKPQRPASPPSSPPASDESGALFEMPSAPPQRLRTAKPTPAMRPKWPREPKTVPPPPPRPALREAGPEHELLEGIRRTRRVRVTLDATVHEAYFHDGKLSLVIDLPDGQRIAFGVARASALVEVIERSKGETA